MLETRHSNIEFLGKDGFQWFIAQVAPDKVWRTENNQNFDNGFRAKIRILGYHPGESEKEGGISDENLPWAHFLVSPQFGAGNNNTGTSFALQGGEMVIGFFLDGEEAQQPVVIGSFYANYKIDDVVDYKKALADGTTGFGALSFDSLLNNSDGKAITFDEKQKSSGVVIDSNGYIRDENNKKKKTKLKALDNEQVKVKIPSGKCEDSKEKQSNISRSLQKFFDKINKLEKFSDGYIDPALGKVINIDVQIDKASKEIAGAMAGIVRGVRYKAFEEINEKVDEAIDFLKPDFLEKQIKAKKLKDGFYCAMENVLNGLTNFVKKFLKGLLGNIINVPLCAAEQFMGGLMAGLNNMIQTAIGPALAGLSAFTGKAMPSFQSLMSGAMSRINAAQKLFECTGGECPQSFDFIINGGPDIKNVMKVNGILDKFHTLSGSGLPGLLDDIVGLSFPNIAGIGDAVGSASGASPLAGLVSGCNVSSKKCTPPRVVLFGGGGIGAAADAVVNEIGEVIGVKMTDIGLNYEEAPFVSIVDDCDIGRGARAEAIVENGSVVNIVVTDPGSSYLFPDYSGDTVLDETGQAVTDIAEQATTDAETTDLISGVPIDATDSTGVDVIGEVVGIKVVSTGANYELGDIIVSDSGQTMTPIIENGRIVGASGKIDQGLSEIPVLSIQTNTGVGAEILPITKFVKREEYTDPIVPQASIIRVISCPRFY